MSADNWRGCPKCNHIEAVKRSEFKKDIDDSYGKIPAKEYLKKLEEYENPKPLGETLREDFSIGIIGDEFVVFYKARCDRCGFKHKFEKREDIDVQT